MLKALHHKMRCFFLLPKCNLIFTSPGGFCNGCPEELYYRTHKCFILFFSFFFQFFKSQIPASLIGILTKYSICSLGNQAVPHRNHKGSSRTGGGECTSWTAPLFSRVKVKDFLKGEVRILFRVGRSLSAGNCSRHSQY